MEGNKVRERQSTFKHDDEGPGRIKYRVMRGLQRVIRGLQSLHRSDHDVRKKKPQLLEAQPVLLEAVPVTQKLDQAKSARELSLFRLVVLSQTH